MIMGAKRCLRFDSNKSEVATELAPERVGARANKNKDLTILSSIREKFKPPPLNPGTTWLGRLRARRNTQAAREDKGIKACRDVCNTSDYGTASESSRKSSSLNETPDPSTCDKISGISSLPSSPSLSEIDADCHLSTTGWDSDSDAAPSSQWDFCDDFEVSHMFETLKEKGVGVRLLQSEGVATLIPSTNLTGHCNFKLQVMKGTEYRPHPRIGTVYASHVVSLEPHGSQFFGTYPAIIFLPLFIEAGPTDVLECLYSNTEVGAPPQWEKLPADQFHIRSGKVVISTHHFSLFTAVIRPQVLESRRLIRQRTGGRLRNAAAPGVEISFPRGCLKEDVVASVRVLFDDQDRDWDQVEDPSAPALASPVVMVGPHGYKFDADQPPVVIRLPLPDYVQIRNRFSGRLSVWQSNTSEDEAAFWERIDVDVTIERDPISRLYTAAFPVYHFSFFKILWDILSTSLFEAKMGMSHFYPYISFSMMCQAFMEENPDTSRFGLEVICHRSDKRLPELTNYKHRVGSSLKPKLIKPGKILVRLKSQLFEADIDAGEDPEMVKEEYDFRGRDFEKQYACRFKTGVVVARGTFGKVVVERSVPGGSMLEQLFEFNLHKTGNETEATPPECSDRWSVVAIKELAGTLRILEDQNWKTLARYIGFTRSEIKAKLQYSADPFLSMMNMYQARGGSPEEFLQALYAVSRELQLGGGVASQRGSQSGSSHGSSPTGSHNSSQSSLSPSRKRGLWALTSLAPWRVNKDEDSDTSGTRSQESMQGVQRKRSNPAATDSHASSKGKTLSSSNKRSGGSGPKPAKRPRRQYSDYSETVSSASSSTSSTDEEADDETKGSVRSQRRIIRRAARSSQRVGAKPGAVDQADSGSEDERSTEKCKRDPRTLTDGDLWRVSAFMNKINWRALGRTLGLQESALVNVESSYRTAGCRECAYQMLLEWKGLKPKSCTVGSLFTALTKENMNEVAKEMAAIQFGLNE